MGICLREEVTVKARVLRLFQFPSSLRFDWSVTAIGIVGWTFFFASEPSRLNYRVDFETVGFVSISMASMEEVNRHSCYLHGLVVGPRVLRDQVAPIYESDT